MAFMDIKKPRSVNRQGQEAKGGIRTNGILRYNRFRDKKTNNYSFLQPTITIQARRYGTRPITAMHALVWFLRDSVPGVYQHALHKQH